jgi:hypothetical protein
MEKNQKKKQEKEKWVKKIENRDAYKMPFSDAEIEMELLSENRLKKEGANYWYKRGRDEENQELKTKSI